MNAVFRRGGRSTIIMALTALSCYLEFKKSSVLPFLLFVSCALMLAARFSCAQVTVDGSFQIEDNLQVDYREASSRRVIAQTAVSFLALIKQSVNHGRKRVISTFCIRPSATKFPLRNPAMEILPQKINAG